MGRSLTIYGLYHNWYISQDLLAVWRFNVRRMRTPRNLQTEAKTEHTQKACWNQLVTLRVI
jgi:hypothetical protein